MVPAKLISHQYDQLDEQIQFAFRGNADQEPPLRHIAVERFTSILSKNSCFQAVFDQLTALPLPVHIGRVT